jgi:hypothetical protein
MLTAVTLALPLEFLLFQIGSSMGGRDQQD